MCKALGKVPRRRLGLGVIIPTYVGLFELSFEDLHLSAHQATPSGSGFHARLSLRLLMKHLYRATRTGLSAMVGINPWGILYAWACSHANPEHPILFVPSILVLQRS